MRIQCKSKKSTRRQISEKGTNSVLQYGERYIVKIRFVFILTQLSNQYVKLNRHMCGNSKQNAEIKRVNFSVLMVVPKETLVGCIFILYDLVFHLSVYPLFGCNVDDNLAKRKARHVAFYSRK